MNENILARASTFIFRELIFDVIRFPLWWYSTGTVKTLRYVAGQLADWANRLSLRILWRNMFKPMYGDYTRSGRLISFFIRLIVFIVKAIVFVVWLVVLIGIFVAWLALPIVIGYFIYLNLTGAPLRGR